MAQARRAKVSEKLFVITKNLEFDDLEEEEEDYDEELVDTETEGEMYSLASSYDGEVA